MIQTMQQLDERITSCTKALDDKISGSDGKRHVVLCGGTGCLSNRSSEILEKFRKIISEKGIGDKVTVELSVYDLNRGRITYRFK